MKLLKDSQVSAIFGSSAHLADQSRRIQKEFESFASLQTQRDAIKAYCRNRYAVEAQLFAAIAANRFDLVYSFEDTLS